MTRKLPTRERARTRGIAIAPNLERRALAHAERERRSFSALVTLALEAYLARHAPNARRTVVR